MQPGPARRDSGRVGWARAPAGEFATGNVRRKAPGQRNARENGAAGRRSHRSLSDPRARQNARSCRRRSGSVDPESPLSESRPPGHADRDLRRRDRPETATRTGPSTLAEPGVRRQGSESPVRRRRIGSANRTPEVAAEFPSACRILILTNSRNGQGSRGSGANAEGNEVFSEPLWFRARSTGTCSSRARRW